MSIAKKYVALWNTDPDLAVKTMVKDGVISWGQIRREEIYKKFKDNENKFPTKTQAVKQTACDMSCSAEHVWRIIKMEH